MSSAGREGRVRELTGEVGSALSQGDERHVSIRLISAGDSNRNKPGPLPPLLKIFRLPKPSAMDGVMSRSSYAEVLISSTLERDCIGDL